MVKVRNGPYLIQALLVQWVQGFLDKQELAFAICLVLRKKITCFEKENVLYAVNAVGMWRIFPFPHSLSFPRILQHCLMRKYQNPFSRLVMGNFISQYLCIGSVSSHFALWNQGCTRCQLNLTLEILFFIWFNGCYVVGKCCVSSLCTVE